MKFLTALFLITLFTACNNKNRSEYLATTRITKHIENAVNQEHPGKKLMENNCYACHNPNTLEENMIAPPFVAVKMHYISEDTSKEEFIASMVAWSKQPSEEKSKMPGAIKKFGLMPYQFFPENTIREIADYIYESEIEEPEWFQEHFGKMHGKGSGMKMKGKKGRE